MTSWQLAFNATTTMLVGQWITGGVVSTTVTFWLQVLVSPHPSIICQVWVMDFGQTPLVTRLVEVMSTLVKIPLGGSSRLVQQDEATGRSNVQVLPHCTVLFVGHITCKQLVGQHPKTVTVWLQLVLSPHPSIICQVLVMASCGQAPLVTRPVGMISTLVWTPATLLVQQVETVGRSNDQVLPHCTVLLVGHCTCRQLVGQHPKTVTVWLQLVLLPHPSIICQVWVIVSCGQAPLVTKPVEVTSTLVKRPVGVWIRLVQQVETNGGSNVQVVPHGTVLLVGHCT